MNNRTDRIVDTARRRGLMAIPALAVLPWIAACGEKKQLLSIASGGTGGVYYPLSGALANILSRELTGYQVTAEVTGGSVDNLKLIGAGRADLAMAMADAAWDAYQGREKFAEAKVAVRVLAVLYANHMHVVTVKGSGIAGMRDLKGRRVSVGSAGSATEVMAMRVLEAYGLQEQVVRERLSVAESVNAMKDRKIDAFFWGGGLPTAAVSDLAGTPGVTIEFLDHAEAVEKMNARHGNLYSTSVMKKDTYAGMVRDNASATAWNLLVCAELLPEALAHDIVRILHEKKAELVMVHKEAMHIATANQSMARSPVPFHPGAVRYWRSQGVTIG